MRIRRFEPADTVAVNAVAVAAFAQYRRIYSDWDKLVAGVGTMAALEGVGQIFVADDNDGLLVGAVAYLDPSAPKSDLFEPHWAVIRMLVVDPGKRGNGIGRQLTEACIQRASEDAANLIALHTSPIMEVALGLYLRMGFKLLRTVPDRFGVAYGVYTRPVELTG